MRGIHNNFNNPQINQIAMEQAAIQAAKNQQPARVRAEIAEEVLKQQEKANQKKNTTPTQTDPDGQKKSNSQNFKNLLYSKEGIVKNDPSETIPESSSAPQTTHIDFTA
jgi:folylpolyglutamate synthase/dihydropteroate synthase